ncbi:MAG: SDR family oxidoreductase [Alphaproteobacteria bacterium]|nr:SDR family oxidoreductase [Alphaproteobacteria bacterium]
MTAYEALKNHLKDNTYSWLITGVAGFIGSNLLHTLLSQNQRVVGLDNFSTGFAHNLERVRDRVSPSQWQEFKFMEGDICNLEDCMVACSGVDFVLHQAALGSVPRSIENPMATHKSNVDGFLNMLVAARDHKVSRFVYASSSSVYGDSPSLPKVEEVTGNLLSPYALTKFMDEQYAHVFSRCYGIACIGLRYFNVFGPHQDPHGAYAAVIPRWVDAMMEDKPCYINGDGFNSRDFCYVENAIQVNLLAALSDKEESLNEVYNVAVGDQTNLLQLYAAIKNLLRDDFPHLQTHQPIHKEFRPGDVEHSLADIGKSKKLLGYEPTHRIHEGLKEAIDWYISQYNHRQSASNAKVRVNS